MTARVEALASQINPHFLFNTLTSISSLIRSQPETARMLIVKLSGLLRRLLRSQEHFVHAARGARGDRRVPRHREHPVRPKLRIEKDIDPGSLDVVVPSMLLQPLVENSIKHGLAPKIGEGRITIRSVRERRPCRSSTSSTTASASVRRTANGVRTGGIGLRNVNERLRVIYGANYQLQLDSVPGQGTCARIVIPELVGPRGSRPDAPNRWHAIRFAPSSSTTSSWRATSCASCSASIDGVEVVAPGGRRRRGAAGDRGARAGRRDARRPDAGADRFRGRQAAPARRHRVAVRVRDRVRPARDRGVRGQRGRLPAEAGRSRLGCRRPSNACGAGSCRTGRPQRSERGPGAPVAAAVGPSGAPRQLAVKVGDRFCSSRPTKSSTPRSRTTSSRL